MPAMIWQDRRGAEEHRSLATKDALMIRDKTGLDLDPTFTAAKLVWVSRHRPEIAAGLRTARCSWGTVDMLAHLEADRRRDLCDRAGQCRAHHAVRYRRGSPGTRSSSRSSGLTCLAFPNAARSNAHFGSTDPSLLRRPHPDHRGHGRSAGLALRPWLLRRGRAQGHLWHRRLSVDECRRQAAAAPRQGIIRTIAWQTDEPCYAYEGFVMYAGKILDWLATRLSLAGGGADVAAQAENAGTSDGVLLVPAFQGLASPWWQPSRCAPLSWALSEATTRGHIAHAGLEAVCYQIRAVLEGIGRRQGWAAPDQGRWRHDALALFYCELQASVLDAPLVAGLGCHDAFRLGLDGGAWRRSLADIGRAVRGCPRAGERVESRTAGADQTLVRALDQRR